MPSETSRGHQVSRREALCGWRAPNPGPLEEQLVSLNDESSLQPQRGLYDQHIYKNSFQYELWCQRFTLSLKVLPHPLICRVLSSINPVTFCQIWTLVKVCHILYTCRFLCCVASLLSCKGWTIVGDLTTHLAFLQFLSRMNSLIKFELWSKIPCHNLPSSEAGLECESIEEKYTLKVDEAFFFL